MARSFNFKEKTFSVGDTLDVVYKIKEGDKERKQKFTGILLGVNGSTDLNRMFTVRKISKSGIGVEKIIPLLSSNIVDIKIIKESSNRKAKTFYIRKLSQQAVKAKMYS